MHITESCDYVLCISGYVQSLVILPGVFQICRQKNGKKWKKILELYWHCIFHCILWLSYRKSYKVLYIADLQISWSNYINVYITDFQINMLLECRFAGPIWLVFTLQLAKVIGLNFKFYSKLILQISKVTCHYSADLLDKFDIPLTIELALAVGLHLMFYINVYFADIQIHMSFREKQTKNLLVKLEAFSWRPVSVEATLRLEANSNIFLYPMVNIKAVITYVNTFIHVYSQKADRLGLFTILWIL